MSQAPLPPGFELVGAGESTPPLPAGFVMVGSAADQGPPTLRQKVMASGPMRFLQGMRDPIDAGAELLPRGFEFLTSAAGFAPNPVSEYFGTEGRRVVKMNADAEREYQASRQSTTPKTLSGLVTGKEDPGFDFARLGGNFASPANLAVAARLPAAATTMGRVGVGAAGGAAGGALSPVADEKADFFDAKVAQVGLGAVTGGVLAPVLGKIGDAVARRIERGRVSAQQSAEETNRIIAQALQEVGARIDDVPRALLDDMAGQVQGALRTGRVIDPAALMRKADFDSLNIPATRGQITRDPMQFANERNLRGVANVGEPLMTRFADQNRRLGDAVGQFGGRNAPPEFSAGERFLESLNRFDDSYRKKVSGLYAEARGAAGRDLEIPAQGLAQDYAQIVRDFGANNIPPAIRARVAEMGLMSGKQQKLFTIDDAEEALQQINKLYDPMKRAEASALDALRGAVKKAVLSADDQGGAYAPAREAASKRFQLHEAVPALKAAIEGRIEPDDFVRRYIVNGKANDVRSMAQLLRKEDPAFLMEMREQIGAQLIRSAFGENPAGDALFRPTQYAKLLREIGDEKLSAMFNASEIAQMKTLGRVGAYINATPTAAAVNYSNNAGWALSAFSRVPGVPSVVSLLSAGQKAVSSRRAVSEAVAAEVPQPAAQPSAESRRRLAAILGTASVGAGAAVGGPLPK